VFHVRVSPGASKEKVIGEHGGALKVSVTAPPEKGKANTALLKLLAKVIGVNRQDLSIISGETGRTKRILLEGRTVEEMEKLLHYAATK
jgi:uncharacterized protein (TIGR00251 family)